MPPPDLLSTFFDTPPVTVVFTFEGEQILWQTTADDIRSTFTRSGITCISPNEYELDPLRREGINRVLARYRGSLTNPRVWDSMDAGDWDRVLQPMRTVAYRQMVADWAGYYNVAQRPELHSRRSGGCRHAGP